MIFPGDYVESRLLRSVPICIDAAMKSVARTLLLGGFMFAGCQTAHDVAVTSWHVVDTPARYVRRHLEGPETTTTTVESDSVTAGRPVDLSRTSPPNSQRRVVQSHVSPAPRPVRPETNVASARNSPSPARSSSPAQSQQATALPTAKPVPDKPGYVFSPFDPNGGYVDVNGYTSGQKVKDPYSGKIFLVP